MIIQVLVYGLLVIVAVTIGVLLKRNTKYIVPFMIGLMLAVYRLMQQCIEETYGYSVGPTGQLTS
jgi:hypothetical protein